MNHQRNKHIEDVTYMASFLGLKTEMEKGKKQQKVSYSIFTTSPYLDMLSQKTLFSDY